MKEVWYCVREIGQGENAGCLLVPWGDPMVYEYALDYVWKTPEEVRAFLQEQVTDGGVDPAELEEWVVVRETLEVVSPAAEGIVVPEEPS